MTDSVVDNPHVIVSTDANGNVSAIVHPNKNAAEEALAEVIARLPWAKHKVVSHESFAKSSAASTTDNTQES